MLESLFGSSSRGVQLFIFSSLNSPLVSGPIWLSVQLQKGCIWSCEWGRGPLPSQPVQPNQPWWSEGWYVAARLPSHLGFTFLTNFEAMLMLLVLGPHFENDCFIVYPDNSEWFFPPVVPLNRSLLNYSTMGGCYIKLRKTSFWITTSQLSCLRISHRFIWFLFLNLIRKYFTVKHCMIFILNKNKNFDDYFDD